MADQSAISDNRERTYPCWTLVLVGRTGNGKSATGNSILGRKAFDSRIGSGGVTKSCQLERTVLQDGQIINVIDTPGMFDYSSGLELMKQCIYFAKDGIHAILVVFSIMNRFSQEEEAVFRNLLSFFGSEILDHMIVVFTGGDQLEENETLENYLGGDCPQSLKEILKLCKNRSVLFDNKTKDEAQKTVQRQKLLSLVDNILSENNERPYNTERLYGEDLIKPKLEEITKKYEEELTKAKKENEKLANELAELRKSDGGSSCTIL